jgi:hypothetical protein
VYHDCHVLWLYIVHVHVHAIAVEIFFLIINRLEVSKKLGEAR